MATIRSLGGTHLQRELAEQFGVRRETIGKILRGEKWRQPAAT